MELNECEIFLVDTLSLKNIPQQFVAKSRLRAAFSLCYNTNKGHFK